MNLSNELFCHFSLWVIWDFFLQRNRLHNIYRGFTHYKYYRTDFYKDLLQKAIGHQKSLDFKAFSC